MEVVAHTPEGKPIHAYVARPTAPGPGIMVLHSSWGLLDDYKEICDRLAKEGFLAVAPDMDDGRIAASWAEAELFSRDRPSAQLVPTAVAVAEWLKAQPGLSPNGLSLNSLSPNSLTPSRPSLNRVGLLGFSRGGATALRAATTGAGDPVVTFYGTPYPDAVHGLQVPALGHFAETDPYEPAEAATALFAKFGQSAIVHPGTRHCFLETTPGTHHVHAAAKAWLSTLAFLRQHLGQ